MGMNFGRIAFAAAMIAGAGFTTGSALAQAGGGAVGQQCREDIAKFCAGIQPGGGRLRPCIKENYAKFSPGCQAALRDVAANAKKPAQQAQ